MIITSISDVHIKESTDSNFSLLKKFFNHEYVRKSDYIVLNGDIFDILIGGKVQYLKKYSDFFLLIESATKNGSKIIYIEGNHDFHIERLIRKSKKKLGIPDEMFLHIKNYFDIEVDNRLVRFTHGDDVEIENESYRKYKRAINNPFVKFLGDYIVPFSFIEWIGHRASNKSRGKNVKKYELTVEGQEFVKDKFRTSSKLYFKDHSNISGLVCGHSHCKDYFKLDDGKFYVNNGFAPASKSFIKISDAGVEFIDL